MSQVIEELPEAPQTLTEHYEPPVRKARSTATVAGTKRVVSIMEKRRQAAQEAAEREQEELAQSGELSLWQKVVAGLIGLILSVYVGIKLRQMFFWFFPTVPNVEAVVASVAPSVPTSAPPGIPVLQGTPPALWRKLKSALETA